MNVGATGRSPLRDDGLRENGASRYPRMVCASIAARIATPTPNIAQSRRASRALRSDLVAKWVSTADMLLSTFRLRLSDRV